MFELPSHLMQHLMLLQACIAACRLMQAALTEHFNLAHLLKAVRQGQQQAKPAVRLVAICEGDAGATAAPAGRRAAAGSGLLGVLPARNRCRAVCC